jgi:putative PIN family toxin of toxin-antitoxin system
MPSVVFDASSLVGALLRPGSLPEQALSHALGMQALRLSAAVAQEIHEVCRRPRFHRYLGDGQAERFLALLVADAVWVEPTATVADCRDAKDNKYLELALAAGAELIVSSDQDLLILDPWRGIRIVTPAEYLRRLPAPPP